MFFNLIPKIKVPYEFYGGIAYPGIKINILSVYLIFIFSLFLTENISNKLINKNIKVILNYTGGIFYLHWSIIGYFRPLIKLYEYWDRKIRDFNLVNIYYSRKFLLTYFLWIFFSETLCNFLRYHKFSEKL